MTIIIDVYYEENSAIVAGVLCKKWTDQTPYNFYIIPTYGIEEYEAGSFYKRELPCILSLLEVVEEDIDTIVIDGYVWLDDQQKEGLGAKLYKALGNKIPVIGVAKKKFHTINEQVEEIFRGQSQTPLFVTSVGIELSFAKQLIQDMHGEYRIPTLLKLTDQLSRTKPEELDEQ